MQWLGDYKEDDTLYFLWSTNAADGASITRATNGEVRVYKDNGVSQTTTGVTDTEDFDGLTGVHACTIDLSADAFYAVGADYSVVLQGATIDGQTVNAVLAHFSIENRFQEVDVVKLLGTAWLTPGVAGTPDVNVKLLGGTAQTGNDVGADVNDILTDTETTLDTLIKDIPTVAEFEARSILAADYVVVGDTIAGVTAISNDVGITQAAADKVRGSVCATGDAANTIGKILYELENTRFTSARAAFLENIDNANLATIADISSLSSTIIGYINNVNLGTIGDISTLTAIEIAYLNAAISSRSSHTAANVRDAILDDATRFSGADIGSILTDTGEIGIAGAGLSDLGGMSSGMKTEVQTEANDALLAQNLDHLAKIAVDTDLATTVHDDSILGYLMATAAVSTYARTDDALQSIRDAVAAAAPQLHTATSNSLVTYGTVDSGTYADTSSDNDTYWQLSPVAVNALDLYLQYEIGTGRIPSSASFNGRFDAHIQRYCNVYAYNYLTSSWDLISNTDTRLSHATSDYNREYPLLCAHASAAGQVRVRIYSTSVTTGDDLYVDMLTVSSVECAGAGLTAAAIRNAIYEGNITVHDDHDSLAFHVAMRFLHRGQITSVTSQTVMTDSALPAVADLFNNHVALFHDHDADTYCLRTIKDMDASGTITLYHAPAITVDTNTYLFVLSQKQKVNDIDPNALAQIESECNDALVALKLDHLIAIADDDDPVDDSIIAKLAATGGDWSTFAKATDSLQSIRAVAPHGSAMVGTNSAALAATALSTAIWTAALAGHLDADISSRSSHTAANVWVADDRALSIPADYKADVSALALEATLTAIKGAMFNESTDSLVAIRDQGDIAWVTATGFATQNPPSQVLNDYKADVSALALEATLTEMKGAMFNESSDSLEAIRDRGDSAWITGADATAANQTTIINHLTDVKGTNFVKDTHSLKQIFDLIQRTLGLTQENHYIDNTTFAMGKLTAARIRIYSVTGSVGTSSDVIATYNVTATYDGSGNMETYKVVKA